MVEAKTQLIWLETKKQRQQLGRIRGIPKTQLGFSLDQQEGYLRCQTLTSSLRLKDEGWRVKDEGRTMESEV